MGLLDRFILFSATGFGLGRIPKAPGTFGTLAALPLIWVMALLRGVPGGESLFLICLVLISIWIADRAETLLGEKDPGCIVIDEMAGYCVSLVLVPLTFSTLVVGFAAFRFFDIKKPGPVRYFENSFKGGAGVVLDDIMAGVLAACLLKIIYYTGVL
jgi:phosphatidylglycerophosphatase A